MPEDRNDKLVRVHLDTLARLEAYRSHPRETANDLINIALNMTERFTRYRDHKGRFIPTHKEEP